MIKQTIAIITAAIWAVICTIKGDAYVRQRRDSGLRLYPSGNNSVFRCQAAIFLSITEVCQGLVSGNHFANEEEEKDRVTFTVSCPLHRCLTAASPTENTRSAWSGEDGTTSFLWVSQFSLLISQDLQNTLLLTSFPSFLPLITPSFDAPSLFLSLPHPFLCSIPPLRSRLLFEAPLKSLIMGDSSALKSSLNIRYWALIWCGQVLPLGDL